MSANPCRQLIPRILLFKVCYLGLLSAALLLWNDFEARNFETMMARWPREGPPVFASRFATWDAAHYLFLSEIGYVKDVPSCAFYPLWPLLLRYSAPLFGGSHVLAGVVLANLCSLAAFAVFYRLVAARWGEASAKWSLIFLIAFPGALFFQFNYTESLFLVLALGLYWALSRERFEWAWVAAALLPLTRGPGVFAVLPIAWHALEAAWPFLRARRHARDAKRTTFSFQSLARQASAADWSGACRASASRAWLLAAPLLGWSACLALMWQWTGNPFEGMQAQKYWGVHSISNLYDVPKFVVGFLTPMTWHQFTGSVLDRCVFLLLLYCIPVLWRIDKGLLVWLYVLGILPAMSGTFTSFTRFASCAFPMFIALGVFLGRHEWRRLRYSLLAVFATLHVVLLWRFVNFRWAG